MTEECKQPNSKNTTYRVYLWIRQISLEAISLLSFFPEKAKFWPSPQYVLGYLDKREPNKYKLFQLSYHRNISAIILPEVSLSLAVSCKGFSKAFW